MKGVGALSKCTRSLSLILTLILAFSLFSVNAFAVDENENLIDSDLSNWIDVGESLSTFQTVDITSSGNNNIISVESNSKGVAIIYDLTEFLKIGESYQFSFTLPNTNSIGLESYSLKWYLANSVDGPVASESRELVTVTNSNKSDFLGDTVTYEFTYNEGYSNTCIALYIWGNDGLTEFPSTNFYINDVSLTRVVTESEKKLDGILGWLQDIWDKLVSIGDGLTEVWTNITSSVTALGDRISSFFSDLGNKIADEFTALTSDFSGYISSLGDRLSGFFDNLSVNISGFFDNLLEGIKDFFRGFGNLILYFNWEGEYTNPFESSDSIIGGVENEEDSGSTTNPTVNLFDGTDFSNSYSYSSEKITSTINSDNSITFEGHCGDYPRISFNQSFNLKANTDYTLSFDITRFDYMLDGVVNSSVNCYKNCYFFVYRDGSRVASISLSSGIGFYEYTFNPPSDGVYTFSFVPHNDSYCYYRSYAITIKNFQLEENSSFTYYVPYSKSGVSVDNSGDVSVQSALDNILEYLSTVTTDIENVMDSITGSIKLFSDFCDEFPFVKALCIFVLALIIYSTVIGL